MLGRAPEPVDEGAPLNPVALAAWRVAHEKLVLGGSSEHCGPCRPSGRRVRRRHGMVGDLFKMATNGLVRVVGDGNNHWPLVYDRDLADLYVRIAASDDASGVFNANDEGDERVNDIVSAIEPYLPAQARCALRADRRSAIKMGAYADALALDQVVRSPRARALGWNAEPALGRRATPRGCSKSGAPPRELSAAEQRYAARHAGRVLAADLGPSTRHSRPADRRSSAAAFAIVGARLCSVERLRRAAARPQRSRRSVRSRALSARRDRSRCAWCP